MNGYGVSTRLEVMLSLLRGRVGQMLTESTVLCDIRNLEAVMTDLPITLDRHRGMAAQKATDIRRLIAEVEANEIAQGSTSGAGSTARGGSRRDMARSC
jgi:hypothetical protein